MNRFVDLLLINPIDFEYSDEIRFVGDCIIVLDLYNGTIKLPNGDIVLASSFIMCAERARKLMTKWHNKCGGQVHPLFMSQRIK